MKRFIPIIITALFLAGCGALSPVGPDDPLSKIGDFTVADLRAADQMAVAAGDDIAHACYPQMIKFVRSVGDLRDETRTVMGAFSTYQRARNARRRLQEGLPTYLRIGCAALLNDSRRSLIRLITRGPAALLR